MNKGNIANILRSLGLMYAVNRLKFLHQYIKYYSSNRKFKAEFPLLKLPPPYMMFESFNMDYRKYHEGGHKTAEWIIENVRPFHINENPKVLDWGCGPARITRHLRDILGSTAEIFGTDYNPSTIQWCNANIDAASFSQNDIVPPLKYEAGSFDLIIGISIFTHLSEKNHQAWADELARVLADGGIAFITTHGRVFRSILTNDECQEYEKGNLVVRGAVKEGHRVYTAFQSPEFMNKIFSKNYKIVKHYEGQKAAWGNEQDYWILKKS